MTLQDHYIKILEDWEKVKRFTLQCGRNWFLTPEETATLWNLKQDAITANMPFDIIDRYGRLFDKH